MSSLDEIDSQLSELEENDQFGTTAYHDLTTQREAMVGELDEDAQRGSQRLNEALQRQQAAEVKGTAAEQVRTMRANIAALQDQQRGPNPTDKKQDHEHARIASEIAALEGEVGIMDTRLPFADLDDETAETTYLTVMAEMEKAQVELKGLGDMAGFTGTRQLLEKQIAAAQEKSRALRLDVEVRKDERTKENILNQLATRKALRARTDAIAIWDRNLREAKNRGEEPGAMLTEYDNVVTASRALEAINRLPEQPSATELAPFIEELRTTAPHVRGSWRR